jgi:hypothetical protein
MKTFLHFISGRKRNIRWAAVAWWAMCFLSACASPSHKEFQKGYERGASDTVKRQYWIQQNLQKGKQSKVSPYRLTLYRMPLKPDPNAKVKTVPYEIAIPIYE